jgi:polysaccharide export outer membrane protein
MGGIVIQYLSSCTTPKNITYFKDIPDTLKNKQVSMATYYTPVIQTDDILQVTIQTLDPSATSALNQQGSASWPTSNAGAGSNMVSGYLVDKEGYVVLPLIGKMMVKGKTTDQVRDEIRKKAEEYYKEPVINVRFSNFKITVLGEVVRPSTYVMPNEKVTLLDAIGAAGDLTIYGKRENVLLIRDKNGKKEFVRFNLNNSNLFESPYYYLQQGDVVYIEPNKSKVVATDAVRLRSITIVTAAISLITIFIARVKL